MVQPEVVERHAHQYPVAPEVTPPHSFQLDQESLQLVRPPICQLFISPDGYPTLTRISQEISDTIEATHFYGTQNTFGTRHTLDYYLITLADGGLRLHGEVRELGRGGLPLGPQLAEDFPVLIEFSLAAPASNYGNRDALIRTAWQLLEVFSDYGLRGLEEILSETSRRLTRAEKSIAYGPIYLDYLNHDQQCQDLERHAQEEERELPELFSTLPKRIVDIIFTIDKSLESVRDICNEQRARHDPDPISDLESLISSEGFKAREIRALNAMYAQRFDLNLGKLHAAFFTHPHETSEVSISLTIDIGMAAVYLRKAQKEPALSQLTIEITSPQRFLGLRERYSVVDRDNIMTISSSGNNSEFFRNLFHALHQTNLSDNPNHLPITEILREYGLKIRPHNLPAIARNIWERFCSFLS